VDVPVPQIDAGLAVMPTVGEAVDMVNVVDPLHPFTSVTVTVLTPPVNAAVGCIN
jgi:hypothetical protein